MADISVTIDGEVRFLPIRERTMRPNNCLLVDIVKDLPGDIPYGRDRIYFHGSIESFRAFANKMLAALPSEPERTEPECTCEQTDVDRFDARGCELHDPQSEWNRARRIETANAV